MLQQNKTFGRKIYPWILATLPVLSQYQVGPLDLDVVVMAVFFLCALLFQRTVRISPVSRFVLVLIGYISAVTLMNLAFGQKFSPSSDIVVRFGKYILYLLIVFFLGNESISYDTLIKAYRVIAFAATAYVIIQTLFFYGAGITLPSKIGGRAGANEVEVGRLRSFYSEPAVMSYSIVPFIVCSLFGKQDDPKNRNNFGAIFVSAGIILSTSGQGILTISIIWALWLVIQVRNGNFKAKNLFLLIGIAIVAVILYEVGILEFALGRTSDTSEGSATDARMSGYESILLLSPMQRIFGSGFGNYVVENTFGLDVVYRFVNYSSLAEFLFTLGAVGTLLWIFFFAGIFRKTTVCGKMLFVAMLSLSMGGCPMTGIQFPLWLTLICSQLPDGQFSRRKESENGKESIS